MNGKKACPVCGKPETKEYTPFCTKRCADVDLSRWLGGVYRIPTSERPDETANWPPDGEEDE